MRALIKTVVALAWVLAAGILPAVPAQAATIGVNTTDDDMGAPLDSCSLREAIRSANLNTATGGCAVGPGPDVILLPAGTYKLTIEGLDNLTLKGDLDVYGGSLEIKPVSTNDRVVIDGNGIDRVFDVSGSRLTLRDLTITGGETSDAGGGLLSKVPVLLDSVTVEGNQGESGGGIALYLPGSNTAEIVNSTISENKARAGAGGIFADGNLNVLASTITGNRADTDHDNAGNGGGITGGLPPAILNMRSTILAGNIDESPMPLMRAHDCFAGAYFFPRYVVTSQEFGKGECKPGIESQTNILTADPGLLPLADNGGPTWTHMLKPGSPAIDSGATEDPDLCLAEDQRGEARADDRCDVGAVEYVAPPVPQPEPEPEPQPEPEPEPEPELPTVKNPTTTVVGFDGKNLHIRLFCPKRFKPACRSQAMPVTKRSKEGRPMATKAAKVKIPSGRWKNVNVVVKPSFRERVQAMSQRNVKLLHVRQVIHAKRLRYRTFKGTETVFHTYKVRTLAR